MEIQDDNLASALTRYHIHLDAERIDRLESYCQALWAWNAHLNLTRHVTHDRFVARDIVDSLALAERIEGESRALDVGSGGGVPGIVLAILRPDLKMSLCESVGKKCRAVAAIIGRLGLNVTTYHARVERLLADRTFDTLVARAVAPLPRLLRWLEPHRQAFDQLLVIKGRTWEAECREAGGQGLLKSFRLGATSTYTTPDSGATNVILQVHPRKTDG